MFTIYCQRMYQLINIFYTLLLFWLFKNIKLLFSKNNLLKYFNSLRLYINVLIFFCNDEKLRIALNVLLLLYFVQKYNTFAYNEY